MNSMNDEKFLRKPQVLKTFGWSNSTLYNRIAAGEFPPPVKIGPRMVGWTNTQVQARLAAYVSASAIAGSAK